MMEKAPLKSKAKYMFSSIPNTFLGIEKDLRNKNIPIMTSFLELDINKRSSELK